MFSVLVGIGIGGVKVGDDLGLGMWDALLGCFFLKKIIDWWEDSRRVINYSQ
jgi:opacity protein-like surface antigen